MSSEQIAALVKGLLPLLGLFASIAIIYFVYILMQRSKNIKKATDHAWIEIWPPVGKVYSYLTPILVGGTVRIEDRNDKLFARYALSQGASKKADWPPGKSNFVQVTLDKLIFREGDAIPISQSVADRPTLDAHQFDSIIENVAVAAAEATRISLENSGIKAKGMSPFLFIYIGLAVIAAGIVFLVATQHGLPNLMAGLQQTIDRMAAAMGIQAPPPVK